MENWHHSTTVWGCRVAGGAEGGIKGGKCHDTSWTMLLGMRLTANLKAESEFGAKTFRNNLPLEIHKIPRTDWPRSQLTPEFAHVHSKVCLHFSQNCPVRFATREQQAVTPPSSCLQRPRSWTLYLYWNNLNSFQCKVRAWRSWALVGQGQPPAQNWSIDN